MICPYCATPNPAQARFCMNCGQGLTQGQVCHSCHTLLPAEANYCFNCGTMMVKSGFAHSQPSMPTDIPRAARETQPLHPSSQTVGPLPVYQTQEMEHAMPPTTVMLVHRPISDMLPSLQRYLPHNLYEPLERRPNERQLNEVRDHLKALLNTTRTYLPRPVFMSPQPAGVPAGGMYQGVFLFGDVSGFTPLSERLKVLGQLGAERITEIINSLFTELVEVLFAHGGTLLKFGGDALLGLFPAEDDSQMAENALRAVEAGLAMQEVLQQDKFAAIDVGGDVVALRIKCGVSSGPYFAAHIGTETSMAYVTTGHTVNLAEQAEGHAHPGQVVISPATFDLLGDRVEVTQTDKSPEDGYYCVLAAAPLNNRFTSTTIPELPDGDVMGQITYLVDRLDCLSPYLNDELIARIVSNPGNPQIVPEHRPVTIMFANYKGISDLIEDMGDTHPELIIDQLNNYFVHMLEVVERYEGTVARMDQYAIGDRLVIFFGAPRAHEDDPVRAVYTALDMQAAVRKHFSALQTPSGIYRFQQRIGINTGHLFAGNAGAPNLRQEYTLMGDDINMAARLMSQAGWQQIFISRKTQERVVDFFDLNDLGELQVKGKKIRIPTYEVLGRRGESQSQREETRISMVGRDEELHKLTGFAQRLLGGRGQIIAIIGDGGLGKSRLMGELKSWINAQESAENLRWLHGQALSFSENMSYWLASQVLYNALDLEADASEDDTLFTLWERGEALMGKEVAREAVPFLANMMNLELEGEWATWVRELDPQVRQKQTFWAMREFFASMARQHPTIIVLDDLHWADETSVALIDDLLEVVLHVPLMLCLIFRPLRDKGSWQLRNKAANAFHHRYLEVTLGPLSKEHSRQVLAELLPGTEFSTPAWQEILDKSAGNPFYIQEVVRSLVDSEAVVKSEDGSWHITSRIEDVTVPDTLQGAILARIDRLTEDSRQALQMAAVIGRRFQMLVLSRLTQADAELQAWLAQLERRDLILPVDYATDQSYLFLDALVQEVAYENLLVQRRQEFHRRVGEALEAILAERIADQSDNLVIDLDGDDVMEQGVELLAYHFQRSDDRERAMRYLERAGRVAQAEFANETALRHYTDLLELLGTGEHTWEKRFEILSLRQQIYRLLGDQPARKADLEAMLALAQNRQDEARRGDVLNNLADLYQWSGNYEQAKETAQEALALKVAQDDVIGQAEALHCLGVLEYYPGNYDEARQLLEKAVKLRREGSNAEGEAWSLMYLGMIHFAQGYYSDAAQQHRQAFEVAEARQDVFQAGIHLTNAARVALRLGKYEEALERFQQSLTMKTRIGDRLGQGFNWYGIGLANTYLGRYEDAQAALMESLTLRQQINDERGVSYSLYGMGLLALYRSQFETSEDYFVRAHQAHVDLALKAEAIVDLSYLGQARLGLEDLGGALEASTRAIHLLNQQKSATAGVQEILFNHFRVLNAHQDSQTQKFLQKAYDAMRDQARRISDTHERQIFLSQVRVNQEIMAEVHSGVWPIEA